MKLSGRVAAVTGAGRGIGKAITEKFVEEGASLVICDVSAERLLETLGKFDENAVIGSVVDVSDREQVNRWVDGIIATHGQLDILVNNAGIGKAVPLLEMDDITWDHVMNVNLKGPLYCSQRVIRYMRKFTGGSIINIASTNGMRGQPFMAHYNSSKAALISLTQTMAIEFASENIRCNCVCPGSIGTELNLHDSGWTSEFLDSFIKHIPVKRFGTPSEVAAMCVFLASEDAGYVTGQSFVVDGGLLTQQ